MAKMVFDPIRKHLHQELIIDKEKCEQKYPGICDSDEIHGTWKSYGLIRRWRIVCYPGTGYFGPHRDGNIVKDEHHRSFLLAVVVPKNEGAGGRVHGEGDVKSEASVSAYGVRVTSHKFRQCHSHSCAPEENVAVEGGEADHEDGGACCDANIAEENDHVSDTTGGPLREVLAAPLALLLRRLNFLKVPPALLLGEEIRALHRGVGQHHEHERTGHQSWHAV